jgi:hypothetical protein
MLKTMAGLAKMATASADELISHIGSEDTFRQAICSYFGHRLFALS